MISNNIIIQNKEIKIIISKMIIFLKVKFKMIKKYKLIIYNNKIRILILKMIINNIIQNKEIKIIIFLEVKFKKIINNIIIYNMIIFLKVKYNMKIRIKLIKILRKKK